MQFTPITSAKSFTNARASAVAFAEVVAFADLDCIGHEACQQGIKGTRLLLRVARPCPVPHPIPALAATISPSEIRGPAPRC